MEQLILAAHLLVALAIIGLIMLQQGKGADMGASFGAGASQTLFGTDGSGNVLTRATTWLVALFFATSFGLALVASNASRPMNPPRRDGAASAPPNAVSMKRLSSPGANSAPGLVAAEPGAGFAAIESRVNVGLLLTAQRVRLRERGFVAFFEQ